MKAFDFLATRVVILLVEARTAKRTIHINPIRELKIKKPKHENLIFYSELGYYSYVSYIWQIGRDEITATKFETARIDFRDVVAAVAVVVACRAPLFSSAPTTRVI